MVAVSRCRPDRGQPNPQISENLKVITNRIKKKNPKRSPKWYKRPFWRNSTLVGCAEVKPEVVWGRGALWKTLFFAPLYREQPPILTCSLIQQAEAARNQTQLFAQRSNFHARAGSRPFRHSSATKWDRRVAFSWRARSLIVSAWQKSARSGSPRPVTPAPTFTAFKINVESTHV